MRGACYVKTGWKINWTFGAPVSDRENSMTTGQRGPLLMQDVYYLEQISHFDEVIPERRMHAKVQVHLVRSQLQMTSHNIQMRKYSQKSENKQRCLHVFYCFRRTWSSRFRT